MKRKAIYAGSFDPITKGHVDIIERGLALFDEIIVVVAVNFRKSQSKSEWFTAEERKKMIEEVFRRERRIKVDICQGLIMNYAKTHGVTSILRGLRAASDFENEFMMAAMNKELNPKVETVFMMTGKNLFFISSTVLKEVTALGGNIQGYVPPVVAKQMRKKIKGR